MSCLRLCGKRRRIEPPERSCVAVSTEEPTRVVVRSLSRIVKVNCRGRLFETTISTLSKLGPNYLTKQADIHTDEAIYLDFSPTAFEALLDALTVAQHDICRALIHMGRWKETILDLDALLRFVLLEWTVGVSFPMPEPPPVGTPITADRHMATDEFYGLARVMHRRAGVFHYLVRRFPTQLPCRFDVYDPDPVHPRGLQGGPEFEQPASRPAQGCMPASVETSYLYQNALQSRSWIAGRRRLETSIQMMPVSGEASSSEFLDRRARSLTAQGRREVPPIHVDSHRSVIFDVGPRRAIRCEGVILGIYRRHDHIVVDPYWDHLSIDVMCDFDEGSETRQLLHSPVTLCGGRTTFCRFTISRCDQAMCRMFKIKLRPIRPSKEDLPHSDMYDCISEQERNDFAGPRYGLQVVEFFGDLLEIPSCLLPEVLAPAFVPDAETESGTARVRKRKRPGGVDTGVESGNASE